MKTCAMLCVLLIAVFGLSACGGGNDAANKGGGGSNTETDKPKTPAEERQAVANRMAAAAEAFDDAALKTLFQPDEHELAEKRIGTEWRGMKADGITIKAKTPTIEETDGKFIATFTFTITTKDGTSNDETNKLSIVEKDGKYYVSFKR